MEILLKKLVWPALAAEANFRNICLLSTSTSRTCVETSCALEWGNPGLKSVRRELKNGNLVLPECTPGPPWSMGVSRCLDALHQNIPSSDRIVMCHGGCACSAGFFFATHCPLMSTPTTPPSHVYGTHRHLMSMAPYLGTE